MSAVLEYLTSAILLVAGDNQNARRLKLIKPQHLNHAMQNTSDLYELKTTIKCGIKPTEGLVMYIEERTTKG
jgi:hypothetical protein